MSAPSPFDVLAEELGAVAGQIEKSAGLRIEAAIADMRRVDAERELRLTALERLISDRLALIKDGEPGRDGKDGAPGERGADGVNGKDGRDGVDGAAGRDGVDGKDGEPGKDGAAGERGLDGQDGRDGIDGAPGRDGIDGKDGERGPEGQPGKLPTVRAWEDRVYYEGEVVTSNGATYQAARDTGRAPPHEDWSCIASSGRDGADGRSFEVRGTYKADEEYRALNVVALNGASFVARKDNPGQCPGEGWQLIASQGKQGKPGERGPQGQKGDRGASIIGGSIDSEGVLTFRCTDGTDFKVDLYPALSRLG